MLNRVKQDYIAFIILVLEKPGTDYQIPSITTIIKKGSKLTSPSRPLGFYLQTALVYKIECLDSVAAFDNTRYVDLVGALANHLDIHITLSEGSEHAS